MPIVLDIFGCLVARRRVRLRRFHRRPLSSKSGWRGASMTGDFASTASLGCAPLVLLPDYPLRITYADIGCARVSPALPAPEKN